MNQNNDTTSQVRAGQVRGVTQASLDNISDAMTQRRTVGAFYTNITTACHRNVDCDFNSSALSQMPNISLSSCRTEFDSHADTCGVNDTAKVLSYTGKLVKVSAYSPMVKKLENIPIVSAALAYDDALTCETFIIIINQALYFGQHLKKIKLNPNQSRVHRIQVEDTPKHLTQGKPSHSITFPEEQVIVSLAMHDCLSYFQVCTPTQNEIDTFLNLTATAENIECNPYFEDFAKQELSYDTVTKIPIARRAMHYIFNQEHEMIESIQANISAMKSSNPQLHVQPEE
jgi:hypothetical protein